MRTPAPRKTQDLYGTWLAKEAEAFEARVEGLETVEPDEWENGAGP